MHRSTSAKGFPSSGDFLLSFDLSYELDLWGRIRRTVAAAREEAQATAADLETVQLSLQAELAMDYFQLRSADAQQRLLNDTVKAYTDALQLTVNRFEGGAAPKSDVAQAQTQLETTRVQATDIAVQRAQFEHAIAILIGQPPAAFSLPPAPLNLQPPAIPVGLPSQLLERRPDIAAAERRVAEANEQIGIARAAYFPTVVLGASAGFEGSSITNWLQWPSLLWSVGASLTQTLFDAGRRNATSEAATANYDALVATYRQTTLTAFQQVEDNLAALRVLAQEAEEQRRAVAVSAGIPAARHESVRRWGGHVPASHHRPDHCADQRTERRQHPAAADERQRAADQGDRRRLGCRRSAAALTERTALPEEKDCFMTDSVSTSADRSKPSTLTATASDCSHQADDMMNPGRNHRGKRISRLEELGTPDAEVNVEI